jgi:hypothetical protein
MATLPPLPPEGTPFLDTDTGRMNQLWRAWFRAFAPLLQQVADDIDGVSDEVAALGISDNWCDFIAEVENGDIVVQQRVNFAGTITAVVTDCDSGTCTVTTKIDGVSIGTANSVSTTQVVTSHNDAFSVNSVISYTISANAACLGARVQIYYTRSLG